MNRVVAPIAALALVLALAAAACSQAEPAAGQSPATPQPPAQAPAAAPAMSVELAPPPTPLPPAPAQPSQAASASLAAATAMPAMTAVPAPQPAARAAPGTQPAPTPIAPVFPFTVVGSNGSEVTFDRAPERIVAFDSAVVEILFALGEGHRVVGTHDFVSYPPEAANVTRVGGAFNMNVEATLALEPDLVFIFFDRFLPDLERVGLKVLYLQTLSDDFTKIADQIRLWGGIVGNPSAAEKLAADFEARVVAIRDTMMPYVSGPTVFQDEGDLWTPGQGTLIHEVFGLLKLQNIAHDISGYVQMSPEIIVERNPQIIIASYGDTISGNPAFKNVLAVRNKRILVPQSEALSIAGPRFVQGIEDLARWVYSALFTEAGQSP